MILFETRELIDPRSFSIMGLSAKPWGGNPIGYFGTGLKYAVAVLVRLNADVRVFIGRDEYRFVKTLDSFRGKDYDRIVMNTKKRLWRNWRAIDLPFTTEYGRNWKPWQAFRELEANTRDEGGTTHRLVGFSENEIVGVDGWTKIYVHHPEFDEAWEKRDEIFLPGTTFESGVGVKIVRGPLNQDLPTASIFWRGLKVYEMGKPGLMTYNLQEQVNLTEDRTLANEWYARYYLARWLVGCDDERVIEKIVTAPETCWEHGLEFDTALPPSAAFHRVMLRHPKATTMAWGYYARYDQRVTEKTFSPFEAHKLPWKVEGMKVVDAGGRPIFDAPYGYQGKWDIVAAAMLDKVNPKATKEEEPVVLCADDIAARTLASAPDLTYTHASARNAAIMDSASGGELAQSIERDPIFSAERAKEESEQLYAELTDGETERQESEAEIEPPEPERPAPDEEERS